MTDTVTNVAPIRPFDDAAALAWLRAQPNGRTTLRPSELASRFGWSRQRASKRLKAWHKSGHIVRRGRLIKIAPSNDGDSIDKPTALPNDTAAATALPISAVIETSVAPKIAYPVAGSGTHSVAVTDILAISSAFTLTGVSAYMSVRGLAVLFPGVSTLILGAAMESGKLCTVAFLGRHRSELSWLTCVVLVGLVFIIAGINGVGVYSQLIAQHANARGALQSAADIAQGSLDARLAAQSRVVEDVERRIQLVDQTVSEAAKRGRAKMAVDVMDAQRKARAGLVDERKRESATLVALQTERAQTSALGRQIATEDAPIQNVAATFGITDPETAIRWLVLFMTLAVDPLAIALTWSVAARRRNSGC
jgi:MarR family